jgi:UDP-N-acetyl-D-galactosamine dehydrogenase
MGSFVADKVVKLMIQKDHKIKGSRVLIMGVTFKENCPDVRNTRVVDIYTELTSFGLNVDVYDPWASIAEVKATYGFEIVNTIDTTLLYDAVIVAVAHQEFLSYDFMRIKENNGVVFDTKAIIDRALVDGRL